VRDHKDLVSFLNKVKSSAISSNSLGGSILGQKQVQPPSDLEELVKECYQVLNGGCNGS
jgi:hypothetical protein